MTTKKEVNIPDKCPHCGRGNLKKEEVGLSWQFICDVCSRGWIVLDGKYWLACFDAGGHMYEVTETGKIIDHNSFRDTKLRNKLWKRAKGES